MNNNFSIEETKSIYGAKIKVIGVGGGGGNMINHMVREGVSNIDLIAANTDAQALDGSLAHVRLQLGEKKTKGLGSGMVPQVAQEAAEESREEIKSSLENADIIFVAAGFGGGTGTGAAPVVAQIAKELGALTVSVVTRPFMFEGNKRKKLADAGLLELKKESDSLVVIPNDKLLSLVDKKLGIKDSFKLVDDVLYKAVHGMIGIILSSGDSDINVDFADVRTVMGHRGTAVMGVGESLGENAAKEALENAIQSPLLDNTSISGALGVLVHFSIHPDYPLLDIQDAMSVIHELADDNADIIFGTTSNANMPLDGAKVTIVATGFESKNQEPKVEPKTLSVQQDQLRRDRMMRMQKASGGYDMTDEILDMPAFLRHQMD